MSGFKSSLARSFHSFQTSHPAGHKSSHPGDVLTSATHILIGLSATITYARLHEVPIHATDLLMMLIGSLLPDIDGKGIITRPGEILKRFLPWRIARTLDSIAIAVSLVLNFLFGHRGFIHAPLLWVSLAGYGAYAGRPLLFWLGFGAFFHVVGDACTVSGIPVLSPISKRRYSFAPIRTGSGLEGLIAVGLLLYCIGFGFCLLPIETRRGVMLLWNAVK